MLLMCSEGKKKNVYTHLIKVTTYPAAYIPVNENKMDDLNFKKKEKLFFHILSYHAGYQGDWNKWFYIIL